MYQQIAPLKTVTWLDVNQAPHATDPAERARYLARFHVRLQDGREISGAAAFVELWLLMPGWRWLGKVGKLPGVTQALEVMYRGFLRIRPLLQRWARRAEACR